MPKTSVIIPVYNTEDYLAATLDSVLAQTQKDIEVILVDDGSTDRSLEIEREYAARDPRVRIIQQANLRQGTARNRGLSEARGKYIYFMDSDDIIVPTHFETCYEACEADGLDFVTFDSMGFVDDPEVEVPEHFVEIFDRSASAPRDIVDGPTFWTYGPTSGHVPWICWLEYFRRDFLIENDLRFVEGIYFEDNDWIVRIYLAAKRLRYLPLKLHRYRERPGSNVHSGFKDVLAWSCFDVYAICLKLREQQEQSGLADADKRVRMVEDIINGVCVRWAQFGQLEPEEKLVARALAFSDQLREQCVDPAIELPLKRIYLRALLNLEAGMSGWPGCSRPVPRRFVDEILLCDLPNAEEAHRVGLYGTGKACGLLIRAWGDEDAFNEREIVFIETDPKPDKTFMGRPVISNIDLDRLDLDAIIITTEKFEAQIRNAIDSRSGGTIPIYVLTRYILALEALEQSACLE
ncbi:MAG: glycosyltransferase [Atopobiaceae bacterium]|nr:glycosyltransferase [Atopobiaceae bacterium]